MKKYKLICKKGEGTFSEVVSGENLENGKQYAIKCMKSKFDSLQQVNNLREIQALKRLTPHPHIVNLEEVLYDQPSGRLAMVFELMDANLYDLISGRREHLDSELVRSLGHQLFIALQYMHGKGIFHRDIKPENVLIDTTGKHLKIADLGSCRSTHARAPLTEYIATRWYRSPECLLTDGYYGPEMDIWGAGCVIFEITALFPLFPGADELDQINRIHKVIGTPKKSLLEKLKERGSSKISYDFQDTKGVGLRHFIPHASLDCINLLEKTLIYDYAERIDATAALDHAYFAKLKSQQGDGKSSTVEKSSSPMSSNTKNVKQKQTVILKKERFGTVQNKQKLKFRTVKKSHEESKIQPENTAVRKRNEVKQSPKPSKNQLPKVGKREPNSKNKDPNAKPKVSTKHHNKFANVQSSGYGRSTYNPFQSKELRPKVQPETKLHKSGGTNSTVKSSLPSIEQQSRRRKPNNVTVEAASRRRDKSSFNLPPIKV